MTSSLETPSKEVTVQYPLEREGTPVVCYGQLAASLVRSLFCGLPHQDKRMAVFVSGSDESSGKDHRSPFLFAGFVGPEEDWHRFFAPAWQERVLDGPPKIDYLHMTDIRSPQWRAEHGLSQYEADRRVDEAFSLLGQMASLYPVGINVNAGMFRDQFAEFRVTVPGRKPMPMEPDYICFLAYAFVLLKFVHTTHPEAEKVDFVVERKNVVTRYIQEFHSQLGICLETLGEPNLAELVGDLIPGDKQRVPLQVADLLCWYTARPTETMTVSDIRRYSTIAHRQGCQVEVSQDDLMKMCKAMSV